MATAIFSSYRFLPIAVLSCHRMTALSTLPWYSTSASWDLSIPSDTIPSHTAGPTTELDPSLAPSLVSFKLSVCQAFSLASSTDPVGCSSGGWRTGFTSGDWSVVVDPPCPGSGGKASAWVRFAELCEK